jgi:hypothetical protein
MCGSLDIKEINLPIHVSAIKEMLVVKLCFKEEEFAGMESAISCNTSAK